MFLTEMVRAQRLRLTLNVKDQDEVDVKRRNAILRELDDSEGW